MKRVKQILLFFLLLPVLASAESVEFVRKKLCKMDPASSSCKAMSEPGFWNQMALMACTGREADIGDQHLYLFDFSKDDKTIADCINFTRNKKFNPGTVMGCYAIVDKQGNAQIDQNLECLKAAHQSKPSDDYGYLCAIAFNEGSKFFKSLDDKKKMMSCFGLEDICKEEKTTAAIRVCTRVAKKMSQACEQGPTHKLHKSVNQSGRPLEKEKESDSEKMMNRIKNGFNLGR